MRAALVSAVTIATLWLAGAASAETRLFIVANEPDGYGVDQCLAKGERCGAVVATSYCRSQKYASAKSYRRVERDEITGAVPKSAGSTCRGVCNDFVAIECVR